MSEAPNSVECPVCGETFDPDAAPGGYCPNTDCGEYRWEPEDAGESDDGPGSESPTVEDTPDVDDDPGTGDSPAVEDGPEDGSDRVECPDCGERVPDMDHCVSCGAALDAGDDGGETEPTCPDCGEEVEAEWAACPYCGTDLGDVGDDGDETDETDDAGGEPPGRVVVEVGETEIPAEDGDTVGRKVRSAHVRAGGDESEAQYIHREHVRFEREGEAFYLVNEGRNGTRLNGERLELDERRAVEDGDEVEFSQVATGTIRLE